nr:GPI inositol-deacylase PGAP1-like protein [Ipomoea batatas]
MAAKLPWTTARQLGCYGGLLRQDGDACQYRFFVHGSWLLVHGSSCHGQEAMATKLPWTIAMAAWLPFGTSPGKPPHVTSMGVGQFFNPDEGRIEVSPQ